ncbi:MAG: DUF1559 domain-containing protein [Planctomycetaceae bacterium]|nr:DUF1559 domain-containing protein [Planctomycetaceae bacterium]MCB9952539.1 DUF1559 domain-containing protein [Planctomycetaceae bacterium]
MNSLNCGQEEVMRQYRENRRFAPRGVSLVEVLVVIAVIGLLLALILPAVQSSRKRARQMQCSSHLHQIGVALHNFEEAHREFPQGSESTFLRPLLPMLELSALVGSDGRYVSNVASLSAPVLHCPADPLAQNCQVSYGLNIGTDRLNRLSGDWPYEYNGFIISDRRQARPSDFLDGTSHTVAMSEHLIMPVGTDPRRSYWETVERATFGEDELLTDQCEHHRTIMIPSSGFGHVILGAGFYDHLLPPNHFSCNSGEQLVPPSSLHDQGVNALFVDGHVRFVSDSVDRNVWRAIGTRAGGEIHGEF